MMGLDWFTEESKNRQIEIYKSFHSEELTQEISSKEVIYTPQNSFNSSGNSARK